MARYLLVRHADAASGNPNPGLTALGREQARAVAHRLGGWRLDQAWSSDLDRAVETAETILDGRASPVLQRSAALGEVDVPADVVAAGVGSDQYRVWERGTVEILAGRLGRWIGTSTAGVVSDCCDISAPTVLVVSHGGPLRVLVCLLLGLPPEMHWSFRLDRASLTVIEWVGDMGTVTLLNDRCHLEGLVSSGGENER